MISVKCDKKETKKSLEEPIYYEESLYPYGLKLRFETEEIKKIPGLVGVKVGQKIKFQASGEVVSVRSEQERKRDSNTVEIQIQEIDIPKPKKGSAFGVQAVLDALSNERVTP